jgi:hypothetical protein
MSKPRFRLPLPAEQEVLDQVDVRLAKPEEREAFDRLLCEHHYLKSAQFVGEQLRYVAEVAGQWVALLAWSAAAYQLAPREQWISWSVEQKRRRLALVANNSRFLILPGVDCPNLATRVLGLCLGRLSADWEIHYGHPILVVESFVDSQLFRGTCYKAQGWSRLGQTKGFERGGQDYYTAHHRPKELWMREVVRGARALLSAPSLPEMLRCVEEKVIPACQTPAKELRILYDMMRMVPEWRGRKGRDYPLPGLLSIIVLATLCGVVRGQRDLAAFAATLSQGQLRALRAYKGRDGRYHSPKETTFFRILSGLPTGSFERALLVWEERCLGVRTASKDLLVAIDGKALRGSTPHTEEEKKAQLVSAFSVESGRTLSTVLVEEKTNEIPAARELLAKTGALDGHVVMLDALHTNAETAHQIVQECGADYLLPVKGNQEALLQRAAQCLPPPLAASVAAPPAEKPGKTQSSPRTGALSPSGAPAAAVRYRRHSRAQSRPDRNTQCAPGRG